LAGPVLQGFRQMRGVDAIFPGEISDCPGEFEHAMIAPGGEVQLPDSSLHQVLACFVEDNVLLQLFRAHVGVGEQCRSRKSIVLHPAGTLNAPADLRGRLAGPAIRQFLVVDARDFDVNVDPVEQGTTDPFLVSVDDLTRAATLTHWISSKSAWAGIHRRNQHKSFTTAP
jgi:hypothetical protein